MNYLIDTDAVSYLMERRPSIVAKVREVGGPALLSVSTISLAELDYGIRIMPEGRKKTERLDSLRRLLEVGMDVRLFSTEAAGVYAEFGAILKRAGIAFKFQDLAIASIAMAENKTLASNDRFFEDARRLCGLRFERWEP